jgi:nicotinamidase-related amidase
MKKLNAVLLFATLFIGYDQSYSELNKNQNVRDSNSILLVIDMQTGLLDSIGVMHIDKTMADQIIKNVNQNINKARDLNIPVVYIKNEYSNALMNLFTGNINKAGSKKAEIDSRITIVGNSIYSKKVPNAFSNKLFCDYMDKNRIETIYIEGIFAEHCVFETGKAGLKRKLNVIMLEDAIGSSSSNKKAKMIKKYKDYNMLLQKQL